MTHEHATAEWERLTDALTQVTPPCAGSWRFVLTQNELDDEDQAELRTTCHECPIVSMCRDYAAKARPQAGMWAGQYWQTRAWGTNRTTEQESAA